jgi:hypothetical protein
METSEDILGRRTNSLPLQRLQYYQGCAIIKLQHLRFEENNLMGTRGVTEKIVTKILRMFEIEGCGKLEPEHRVAAIIDQEELSKALAISNLTRETLLDPTKQTSLILDEDDLVTCVYGKHRLKAGERFGESVWPVDLYRDGKAASIT